MCIFSTHSLFPAVLFKDVANQYVIEPRVQEYRGGWADSGDAAGTHLIMVMRAKTRGSATLTNVAKKNDEDFP